MVIIEKEILGGDGNKRIWALDTENKTLIYKGYAKDFQNNEAQDILNELNAEDNYKDLR